MKIDFTEVQKNIYKHNSGNSSGINNPDVNNIKEAQKNGYRFIASGIFSEDGKSGMYSRDGHEQKEFDRLLQNAGMDMKNMHNFMAITSNSMSGKDFGQMMKEGFNPGKMEPDELVTVMDRIKITLAESGHIIVGYNDDISSDTVDAASSGMSEKARIEQALHRNDMPVTGNNIRQMSGALELSESISAETTDGRLSDEAMRYLIDNGEEPTLDNVYKALYAGQRLPESELTEEEIRQLRNQMESVIMQAGLEVNDNTIEDAKWLLENHLPLNTETLKAYEDLKSIVFPVDENELLDNAAAALAEGKRGVDALLIHKERVLAQTQLKMTTEANIKLLKSDYYIDTTELMQKVDELVQREQEIFTENNISEEYAAETVKGWIPQSANPLPYYENTINAVDELKQLPAALVGELTGTEELDLNEVVKTGERIQAEYENANRAYETMATPVRRDLGDSINKAFNNVDNILSDMNLKLTEENRRAVRILGYNQMDISEENIAKIKETDSKISGLINNLTPGNVVKLIREGRNPLTMDVDELSDKLREYAASDESRNMKYSEYLWKLEKNQQISAEEKESYIGIYRLFYQVEKSDGAVIGALINQGSEINIKNLLHGVRSRRAQMKGMDISVNDEFGALEEKLSMDFSRIDTQISTAFMSQDYYERKNSDVLDTLDPGKLKRAIDEGTFNQNTTLEETAELMQSGNMYDEDIDTLSEAYNEKCAEQFSAAMAPEAEVMRAIENFNMPVCQEYIDAFRGLLFNRGDVFKQLRNIGKQLEIAEMIEDFETEDGVKAAIEDMVQDSQNQISEEIARADMTSDYFNQLMMLSRQVHLIGAMARQHSYEVPMEIAGELTAVNVRLISKSGEGRLSVTIKNDEVETLSIQLKLTDNIIDGIMLSQIEEGEEYLSDRREKLIHEFEESGYIMGNEFPLIRRADLNAAELIVDRSPSEEADTKELYDLAKLILNALK